MNVNGETMERLDVGGMTLEGFFLADYQRLRQENEELRRLVEGVRPSEYGLFDLGRKTECVRVSVGSRSNYGTEREGITSESLRKALEMGDDELWDWAMTPTLTTTSQRCTRSRSGRAATALTCGRTPTGSTTSGRRRSGSCGP